MGHKTKTGIKYMCVTLTALLMVGAALAMPAMAAGDSAGSSSTGADTLGIVLTIVLVALIAFFFVRFLIVLRKTPKAPSDTAQTPRKQQILYSSTKNQDDQLQHARHTLPDATANPRDPQ